jgi:hypothetical protein
MSLSPHHATTLTRGLPRANWTSRLGLWVARAARFASGGSSYLFLWQVKKKRKVQKKERKGTTTQIRPNVPPRLVACDTLCSDRFPSLCRKKERKLQKEKKGSKKTKKDTVS